jgi:hypothetical protein
MRLFGIATCVVTVALVFVGSAGADPKGPPVTLNCDNGKSVVVTLGPPNNQSSVTYVADSTSIYSTKSLTITDPTSGQVVYSFVRGLQGFDASQLTNCTADAFGLHFDSTGFFTPR